MDNVDLPRICIDLVNEYIKTMDKADNLIRKIHEEFEKLGIDTDSIEFQQIVGDTFAYSELDSTEQLTEFLNRYLNR